MMLSNDTSFEKVPCCNPHTRTRIVPSDVFNVPVAALSTPQLYKLVKFFKDTTAIDELKKRGVFV